MAELTGGNSNQVKKDGQTVIRKMGKWSSFVHALLKHLAENGFNEAPLFIAVEGENERLSFIEGDVGNDPLKPEMCADIVVTDAAKLLRKLHDATQNFVMPPDSEFFIPVESITNYEVICHNDFAPYNCVFREGRIIGVIDFDTAAPNTRLWDIAYAVYRFVPLMTDAHCFEMGYQTLPNRAHRLKLFCDAYGLEDRREVIPNVIRRIEAMIDFMQANDFNPDHIPFYQADLAYIREHQATFFSL